mmetsp:Transcript_2114/g.5180  ORF Transcript_2114/g.5180 Transcript_2114/m.5180 type:complete len:265 (+) Transcript_2114:640-1434(+)
MRTRFMRSLRVTNPDSRAHNIDNSSSEGPLFLTGDRDLDLDRPTDFSPPRLKSSPAAFSSSGHACDTDRGATSNNGTVVASSEHTFSSSDFFPSPDCCFFQKGRIAAAAAARATAIASIPAACVSEALGLATTSVECTPSVVGVIVTAGGDFGFASLRGIVSRGTTLVACACACTLALTSFGCCFVSGVIAVVGRVGFGVSVDVGVPVLFFLGFEDSRVCFVGCFVVVVLCTLAPTIGASARPIRHLTAASSLTTSSISASSSS